MQKLLPEKCRDIIKRNIKKLKLDPQLIYPHDGLTFYFLMSQDCNGNCPYCYQPKSFRQKVNLSKKIIDDSMDFVLNNFDESKIKFCLFGGEPTLNWDMCKYIIESYQTFRFQIMTNGIFLYENQQELEWLKNQMFHVDLSISIEPLKRHIGEDFSLEKIKPLLDCIITNKADRGEVYLIVTDPEDPWTYQTFVDLLELGIPKVRVAIVRQNQLVLSKYDKFVELFKRFADYVYFRTEPPLFARSSLDVGFTINVWRKYVSQVLKPLPPTMCGCGYAYLAIDHNGDIYPCDWFANFPEFKVGTIYDGFNDNSRFFYEANNWLDGIYEDCKDCPVSDDIRMCPRAMCLAENYQESGNPLKPTKIHCLCNKIEYEVYEYIAKGCVDRGYVQKYDMLNRFK